MNVYTVGDLPNLTATFQNAAGQPADPTTITFTVRAPDGSVSTPTATRVSQGIYQGAEPASQPGEWRWKAVGTGAVQAASTPRQGIYRVEPQAF